jgi:hypothetical protein
MSRPRPRPGDAPGRRLVEGGGTLSAADAIAVVVRADGSTDIEETMRVIRRQLRRQAFYLPLPGRTRMLRQIRADLLRRDGDT